MDAVLTALMSFVRKIPPASQQVAPARKERASSEVRTRRERLLHKNTATTNMQNNRLPITVCFIEENLQRQKILHTILYSLSISSTALQLERRTDVTKCCILLLYEC